MKTKLCLGIFLLAAAVLRAQTNDLTALLQQGLFEEQASRNLDAAIADYSSLAAQFDKDRQLAATAVFRLGECYRAQGRTNEAAAQYQRILRDFSDQQTLATLSRQDLAGMGVSASQHFAERVAAVVTSQQTRELELVKKLQAMPLSEVRQVAPTLLTDATLINLIYQYNQRELDLLQLRVDHGDEHPEVKKALVIQDGLGKKIQERLAGLAHALSLDLAAAGNPATMSAEANSPALTDDEDRETQRIQTMIQNSPDLINAPDGHGHTPLENAAINDWLKVAAFLLDHGADVNAGKFAALNLAANAGNRAMVEFLLTRGADINAKAWQGKTPLLTAVELGYPAVTDVLLANKADVNAPDDFGNTPLVPAAEKKQMKIIQALLAAGANPNLENKDGRTPFSVAAASGSPEIVKLFLAAKADPNGGRLDAPLLVAIHAGDAVTTELLLQTGANPNAKGEDDWQPSVLGGFGRPVGRGSETPMALAVSTKQLPMVKLLLKFKADPNDSQTYGQSVLFSAVLDTNLLAALLDAGGKADARRRDGWTLLDGAVVNTNLTAVQLLLKSKADPNDSQIDGRSILFRALCDTNILEALLDAGAKVDPVTPDETEWTPLGAAANESNVPAMEILLKHGANPNFHNRNGVTPLHRAAYVRADRNVFELLLEAKANPNVRTGNGKTPLDELKDFVQQHTSGPQPGMVDPAKQIKLAGELADLLRQHGALDNLPNWDRIAVSRPAANFSADIFRQGTNHWNHFTLLELIYRTHESYRQQTPFPDFIRVTVVRPGANGAAEKRIEVNLLTATNTLDFARDLPLEFGDVVEIPERGHTLAEQDIWLDNEMRKLIWHFRETAGEVRLVVAGGQTVQVPLNNWTPSGTYLGEVLRSSAAQNALTSGSDLSRVKVTRRDLKTNKADERILDCSRINFVNGYPYWNSPDLLLRDGDVLEVPLKS
jgi:ankyrin repeat protein